jgi:hypothetical protein
VSRARSYVWTLYYTLESFPMYPLSCSASSTAARDALQEDIRFASYSVVRDPWDGRFHPGNFVGGRPTGLDPRGLAGGERVDQLVLRPLLVELNGIEPSTSGLQSPRSPS